MFVLFLKILENAVPLATGQVLAESPKFKPDFLVEYKALLVYPTKFYTSIVLSVLLGRHQYPGEI